MEVGTPNPTLWRWGKPRIHDTARKHHVSGKSGQESIPQRGEQNPLVVTTAPTTWWCTLFIIYEVHTFCKSYTLWKLNQPKKEFGYSTRPESTWLKMNCTQLGNLQIGSGLGRVLLEFYSDWIQVWVYLHTICIGVRSSQYPTKPTEVAPLNQILRTFRHVKVFSAVWVLVRWVDK